MEYEEMLKLLREHLNAQDVFLMGARDNLRLVLNELSSVNAQLRLLIQGVEANTNRLSAITRVLETAGLERKPEKP